MNVNDLISQALSDALPLLSSDIQMFLVWSVGCLVAIMAIRLLSEAFGLIGGKSDDDDDTSSPIHKMGDR